MTRKAHTLALETATGDHQLDAATRTAALQLVEAVQSAGLAVGWLTFEPPEVPVSLAESGAAGSLRSVQIGEGGSLTWKPRRGAPVLADLLREHCAGCRVVFLEGRAGDVALRYAGEDAWVLRAGESSLPLDSAQLVARLRRPRLLDA